MTKRFHPLPGLLFAIPTNSVPVQVLAGGQTSGLDEMLGPSITVNPDDIATSPLEIQDQKVSVWLIDFSSELAEYAWTLPSIEDLQDVVTFSHVLPDDVIAAALGWTMGKDLGERVQFYSAAEEEEMVPGTPLPRKVFYYAQRRRPSPHCGDARRVAGADLSHTPSAGSSNTRSLNKNKSHRSSSGHSRQTISLEEALSSISFEWIAWHTAPELFGVGYASRLARAVLEQSKALTTLVGQIASSSSDPMGELASTTGGISSKGALMGRAKLQQELASQKGAFFTTVVQQMARRMSPTSSAELSVGELHAREVYATRYLERFGGFGRHRELGFVIWQVAMTMDFTQQDNALAARDVLALLFVFLEQMVMDNGKIDVAVNLALMEDPPQGLFSNRAFSAIARQRAFAATADQKWVTVALQYLKQLDTIQTRRGEATKEKPTTLVTSGPNPKKKAKRKGKGKRSPEEEQE